MTKATRITFRATAELADRIEAYRAWLEKREQDRVTVSRAVGKLIRVGLQQFEASK